MITIPVATQIPYDVLVGENVHTELIPLLKEKFSTAKVMLVSDNLVWTLYGETLWKELTSAGFAVSSFAFPHGEENKTLFTYERLLECLTENQFHRDDLLIAIGGGVVSDVAGFAAATYLRGINWGILPTTLLSAVDASVGGKTAVNLAGGKNQVGCFYQPSFVLCDTSYLKTLSSKEWNCGLGEVIKYSMISKSFEDGFLSQEETLLPSLVASCINVKKSLVEEDEKDHGIRQLLNFGHTFGHAIEACSEYSISHGEAVVMGMHLVIHAAVNHGLCDASVEQYFQNLCQVFHIEYQCSYPKEQWLSFITKDKKNIGADITLVVPTAIKTCTTIRIPISQLGSWLTEGDIS